VCVCVCKSNLQHNMEVNTTHKSFIQDNKENKNKINNNINIKA